MSKHQNPTTGSIYGRLVVIGDIIRRDSRRFVDTQCVCGTVKTVSVDNLLRGTVISCGCARKTKKSRWHGESHTPLHYVWLGMKQRCVNPNNKGYINYGGRGITVCEEWLHYLNFRDWSRTHGYTEGLQLDRIDNDGGYSPDNCRFVTSSVNNRNRRDNHALTAFGETKCLSAWAEDSRCMVSRETLKQRITTLRWNTEKALTTPARERTLK